MTSDVESAELTRRQELHRCLSVLFCEPRPVVWREDGVIERIAATAPPAAAQAVDRLRACVDAADDLELQRVYARLFVGPGPLAAPPYGSIYLDAGRRLMGPSTERVVEAFRSAGLVVDEQSHEAPDHVAAELEFLQYLDWRTLAAGTADAALQWSSLRRLFFESLFAPWTPALSAAIREAAPATFYAALGDCLELIVEEDRRGAI